MIRNVLLGIIFLACLANWFFSSVAAKSAMHETTAAVVGLSALVALCAALLNDAIGEIKKEASRQAQEQHRLLLTLHASSERQAELLTTLVGIVAASGAVAQRLSKETVVHLHNLDAAAEHANALLKWIGEQKTAEPVS